MSIFRMAFASILVLFLALPAYAADATLTLKAVTIGVGVGGTSGEGVLTYKGQHIPFKMKSLGLGEAGISKLEATGVVNNLTFLEKFNGQYNATKLEGALIVGKGVTQLHNQSGVHIELKTKQTGIKLSASLGGATLTLDPDAMAKALAALNPPPVRAVLKGSIFFDTGSAKIRANQQAKLNEVIAFVKKTSPAAEVILTGYADTTGAEKMNQKLSEKRAGMVFGELKKRAEGTIITQLPPERIEITGRGQIGGPANTPDQKGRRVDILVISPTLASN